MARPSRTLHPADKAARLLALKNKIAAAAIADEAAYRARTRS